MKIQNFGAPILLTLLMSMAAIAQQKNIRFGHLGTSDGLSNSNVISTLQDRRGFMWFGTRDGLNKYDGYSCTVYKNSPGDSTTKARNKSHS